MDSNSGGSMCCPVLGVETPSLSSTVHCCTEATAKTISCLGHTCFSSEKLVSQPESRRCVVALPLIQGQFALFQVVLHFLLEVEGGAIGGITCQRWDNRWRWRRTHCV